MVNPTAVKNKITSVLKRTDLSKNLVINKFNEVENKFREKALVFLMQDVKRGILLDYSQYKQKYDKAGKYKGSSFLILFPITVTVSETDTIEFDGNEYKIRGIDTPILQEQKLLNKVFVTLTTSIDKC